MSVRIYDTTLRDGTQRAGMSLSCNDKIRVAQRLDAIGVAYIEGGWPGSNPKDAEFFERARNMEWAHAKITAFGSTRRVGVAPEDDDNLKALLDADTPTCTIVGKTWTLHVTDVLRTSLTENLSLIEDSIRYLAGHNREVVYDAEHFFDGYGADREYALSTLEAAISGGASTVVLCDTNGGTLPWDLGAVVKEVVERFGDRAVVGIHCHNDSECAVANSVAAVRSGARHVQGTVNGYGERCGNANLCAIIPNVELKLGLSALPEGSLAQLSDFAHFVAEVANQAPDDYAAYVGRNAFAHKGGIHVAAMRRNPDSYQHITPELVGNEMRVVVSELSGRGNLVSKAEEMAEQLGDGQDVSDVLRQIKENESRGFSYEAAEASVVLMLRRSSSDYRPPYQLVDYMVNVEHRDQRGTFAEATVKVNVNGEIMHTAAEGDGPVSALDRALRKALLPAFPALADIKLVDYKVRILDGVFATSAITRVLIDSTNGQDRWGTVGASNNIIEASWSALTDAIEYGLSRAPGAEVGTPQPLEDEISGLLGLGVEH
ncbi:MAG: citramalate synthase [Myxococcota bacterium]